MKSRRVCVLATCLLGWVLAPAAEPLSGCLPAVTVPITVRIGDAPATAALLQGGSQTPLSLFEAASGQLLWSAAAHAGAIGVFAGLDTTIAGSLAVLDLDADGIHDRIYAGDLAGRLWRFDLHHGQTAALWAAGSVFADLRNDEGRGFLAAPDVSLAAPPDAPAWLNIAIGTAAPGNDAASNRFYALRDHAVHERWSAQQHEQWQPLREQDLQRIAATAQAPDDAPAQMTAGSPGWYIELGHGHVVAPTLTVDHRVALVIATTLPRTGEPCEVLTRIASLDLLRQQVLPAGDGSDWLTTLPQPVSIAAGLSLLATGGNMAPCSLGGQRVAACDVDTRPRRTWWRRSDAE